MPDDPEVRELRYRLAQANKLMGRQGQTIHALRGELAETRELNSKIERGEIRSLERLVVNLQAERVRLTQRVESLSDKLWGAQPPQGTDDTNDLLAMAPQTRQ